MAFDTGLGSPAVDDFPLDLTSGEVGTGLGGMTWGLSKAGGELHCVPFMFFSVLGVRQTPGAYKA